MISMDFLFYILTNIFFFEPYEGIKLQNSAIPLLIYVDDVVLMDESQDGIQQLFERFNNTAQKIELHINEQKIEYMIVRRRDWVDSVLEINQFRFEKVSLFKYLRTIINEKNDITKKVATRI